MSDTAPLHPEPLHGGAAGLAARLAILGALLFLGVAGGLQLVRDDLAWQQATLSQYLRGPYGLLLRTMYCLLAVAIVALAMGLYMQLAPRARSASTMAWPIPRLEPVTRMVGMRASYEQARSG